MLRNSCIKFLRRFYCNNSFHRVLITENNVIKEFQDKDLFKAKIVQERFSDESGSTVKANRIQLLSDDLNCVGCGSHLQCDSVFQEGYVSPEVYATIYEASPLHSSICLRCVKMREHQKYLEITVSFEEFCQLIKEIQNKTALILYVLDVMTFPINVYEQILDLIGSNKKILVVVNKLDVLPPDTPRSLEYLVRIRELVSKYFLNLLRGNLLDVQLVSAKTGFGLEALITSIQNKWKHKGDVYLIGSTNSGKSTLFNALLSSDFCKSKAQFLFDKATICNWPGTTLNFLRFPIRRPRPEFLKKRRHRLSNQGYGVNLPMKLSDLEHGYIFGKCRTTVDEAQSVLTFDSAKPWRLAAENLVSFEKKKLPRHQRVASSYILKHYTEGRFLYDTPGIVLQNQHLPFLNAEFTDLFCSYEPIVPKPVHLSIFNYLFLGNSYVYFEFLDNERHCDHLFFTAIVPEKLPLRLISKRKVDMLSADITKLSSKYFKQELPLISKVFYPQISHKKSVDVLLSDFGFLVVRAPKHFNGVVKITAATPGGLGMALREKSFIPYIDNCKASLKPKTNIYSVLKTFWLPKKASPS